MSVPSERAAEAPRYDGIEVDRLGELDPDSFGILDPASGGLGPDAWAGSSRAQVSALMRDLPAEFASPTLRSLATRLLLSRAKAPAETKPELQSGTASAADAPAADDAAQEEGSDFLRLRAQRLYAMGELAGLNRLLSLVPQRVEDPWLAQARVDGLLFAGEDEKACALASAGLAQYPRELYWSKAQVFCQFMAGQTDQALLGLDLLREQVPDGDSAFFALANGFITGSPPEVGDAQLTPLTLAMLRKTDGTLPMSYVEAAAPMQLHGVAMLSGADAEVRAAAVERLVEVGALPGERLAAAYDDLEFTDAELHDALNTTAGSSSGGDGAGVRERALLLQAAVGEDLAATRAELLRAAFASAARDGRNNALARAALPLLAEVPPTPELAWFAPTAARSLFRVGQFERAGAWLSVLRIEGSKQPEFQDAYLSLTHLRRLTGGSEPLKFTAGDTQDRESAARRLLLLVLSRSLGQEEEFSWIELARGDGTAAALPRLPSLLALSDAALEGQRGETVLLAVTALGGGAPADSHPLALGYAVSALQSVGLGNEARALAVEAALAAGT